MKHMVGISPCESSNYGASDGSQERQDEMGRWYMSRKEIEESSPSRRDGIDLKKETFLRKSYCTFLQDLGMKLKVPQVTIATAIIFCHRFFLRQSHAKNDRRTIATVCMFLAGKVEETPRPLKDVILVSYEIIHKKDSGAAQRIKQKEVYEQQKELILVGERLVLATLGFDLNVHHPYKPLVEAIKKFSVAKNALAQVAWNFVNDGLRTSLCLQFKPHHIAAGAIFLAAKFLRVKLPSDGEKVWWQEFDVTPRQLEEVSNQMLELYEQNKIPQSQGSEAEVVSAATDGLKQVSSRTAPDHLSAENPGVPRKNLTNDNGSVEVGSVITDQKVEIKIKEEKHAELSSRKENIREVSNRFRSGPEHSEVEEKEPNAGRNVIPELGEWRDDSASCKSAIIGGWNSELGDKFKAAIEKRKKSRGETVRKKDVLDEDDLIERELEDGVELAAEEDRRERTQSCSMTDSGARPRDHEIGNAHHADIENSSTEGLGADNAEEGEMINDAIPTMNSRNDRQLDGKRAHDYVSSNHYDSEEDAKRIGRVGYADMEHRMFAQENHS